MGYKTYRTNFRYWDMGDLSEIVERSGRYVQGRDLWEFDLDMALDDAVLSSPWHYDGGDVFFPDSSMLADWGKLMFIVNRQTHRPFGAPGNMRTDYEMTLVVPPAARYFEEE